MAAGLPTPDRFLDVRGLLCPMPTLKASLALEDMAPRQVLELRADDPATRCDLPGWCRDMGHQLLAQSDGESFFTLFIQKKG